MAKHPHIHSLWPWAFALLTGMAAAQGTHADYERAARLRELTAGKVFHDRVTPRWSRDGTKFWYRNRTRDGSSQFVLVDCVTGAVDREYKPESTDLVATNRVGETKPGGDPAQVSFVNETSGAVEIQWIGFDRQRRSYGEVAAGETMTLGTYLDHSWVVTSAGGKLLAAYTVTEPESRAVISSNTVAPEGRPERRQRSGRKRASHPEVFLRDFNVYLKRPGGEIALTSDGNEDHAYVGPLHWSPDAKKLVVFRRKAGERHIIHMVESSPADQIQPKLVAQDYLKPGDRIEISKPHLFDMVTRREIPLSDALFPNPWSLDHFRWAEDSSRFTVLYNQRGHQVMRVVAVDARTGDTKTLLEETSPTFIDYSGKQFSQWVGEDELIWMSERDGWCHLYLYDMATGQVKNQITKGEWVVQAVDQVDPETRQIWFRAGGIHPGQDPYYTHHARIGFDGQGLTLLTEGDGTHSIEYSPNRKFYIDTWSRVDLPPVSELRRSSDGRLVTTLERGNWDALLATGWRAPERFVAKGRDGVTDIHGIIIRPMHHDTGKKYPVIEAIYAGPQSFYTPKAFQSFYDMQELAELGFIVVKMDGMGTSGRSKKFHDMCWKNLADAGFPDRIAWMRAAAAKDSSMDLSRVGIYGGSAGGQNALGALLTHGEFYQAGAADCGCHDNRMDKIWWNEQWMGWPVGKEYEQNSNVTLAPNLQGKLLLTVGELDRNVDPASTMQVANALIQADKDFELIVFPGAGHGAGESAYGRRRRADFFVRSLWGVEPRSR